jgi:tryptophan synthase alpha chain
LIAYVTVGYPDVEATLKAVSILAESGCDIVELGIPFSDPLADGVTIQQASFKALQAGITPKTCLDVAGQIRKMIKTPLIFMSYFNPIFSFGMDKFCAACSKSGVDGLIIPDLPPDEGHELGNITRSCGLDLIYLLAPTSPTERVELVAEKSSEFIYLVSVTGITGTRDNLPADLGGFVARVRKATAKPLCVGFGIATPEQAKRVAAIADGVIVGSRIIQLMESDPSMQKVAEFTSELRQVLDGR